MINLKRGFSLAELLIAIAIISIIATMGFTISKNGIERAYDKLIYNGYNSLSLAISDAFANGFKADDVNFINFVMQRLNTIEKDGRYIASNGIIFSCQVRQSSQPNQGVYFVVTMQLPYVKWVNSRGNTKNSRDLVFLFLPNERRFGLIPIGDGKSDLDLQNRHDLLPFTIEDGESAKIIQRYNPLTEKMEPPEFISNEAGKKKIRIYSYKEAFCLLYGSFETEEYAEFAISCGEGSQSINGGVLKLVEPSKIF